MDFYDRNFLKVVFSEWVISYTPEISPSVALRDTKPSGFIPFYILKVLTVGFVDVFTASFIQHFSPKNMAKFDFSVPVTHLQSDKRRCSNPLCKNF